MRRYMLVNFFVSSALVTPCMAQQQRNYTTEAGIDSDGNIYVASDAGKRINMATVGHCMEARFADDKQTVGCSVARGTKAEETMQSLKLEIYLRNGKKQIIETEMPMMDWHFWRDGQQVAVYSHSPDGKGHYALMMQPVPISLRNSQNQRTKAYFPNGRKVVSKFKMNPFRWETNTIRSAPSGFPRSYVKSRRLNRG